MQVPIMKMPPVQVPDDFLGQVVFLLTKYSDFFIVGLLVTLLIAILGTIFGSLIGSVLAILRNVKAGKNANVFVKILAKLVRILAVGYIDIMRGTPMIVQAMIFFYGFASPVLKMDPLIAGIIIISFNSAAYIAEIIRSGINSTPVGQMEAARSLGLNHLQAMRKIILPQAIRNSVPALMNELIVNVKDSAILSVIGVSELFLMGKSASSEFYLTIPAYTIVAGIYLITTMSLTKLFEHILNNKKSNRKVSIPSTQTMPEEV